MMRRSTGNRTLPGVVPVALLVVFLATTVGLAGDYQPTVMTHERQLVEVQQVPSRTAPPVDLQTVAGEDQEREDLGLAPRFAIRNEVYVTPETDGLWEQIEKGQMVWRFRVTSPGAKSLNLGFSRFEMPRGGQLFIHSSDLASIVRPFTAADNASHGELWTPVVPTDDLVIEVTLPTDVKDALKLELTSINVGYRGFGDPVAPLSGACNNDVACPEGDPWRDEIASAAVYSTGGSLFCSGGMINNTAGDQTPLFLTAAHCSINSGNAASLVVYWNYESSACGANPPDGSLNDFQTGATHLATSSASDFTLVQLDSAPDPAWGVTWAGWDRSGNTTSSAVAIHHPNTDEKRISFENDPTTITSYLQTPSPGNGTHIRVIDWDDGTTEGGSSGSHLFDSNHRVVGQLHGGFAACGNDDSDWYGRLSVSWNGGGSSSNRLSDWLDPGNTGAMTTDTLVPEATGGCCNGASCTVETEADCLAASGTYLGDGASCTTEAGNPTTYNATPGIAIPDGGGPGNPATDTISVPDSFAIGDVAIDVDVSHTYVGDVIVTISHGGTSVTVIDRMGAPASAFGCNQANFDVTLDDEGTGGDIESQCTANLSSPPSYTPNQALSAFDGMSSSGNWTISVSDNAAQDTGTLNGWSLRIDGQGPSPCGCNTNQDCDDSLFCNGAETCSGGSCQNGSDPCPGQGCDEGNDVCFPLVCDGDLTCETGEDCNNCASDCIGGSGQVCGNGICEPGEDCQGCATDCRGKLNGNPNRQFCCGGDAGGGSGPNPIDCNDSRCTADVWECSFTASDYCCGDDTCEGAENESNCAVDCVTTCSGPGDCDDGVTCTDDACVDSSCVSTANDSNCPDDGLFCNGTEFCDAIQDCSSTGDPCAAGETCNEATDQCDSCGARNDSCSTGADCCSGICKNNGRCR